jgi:hypothetical protein
MNGFWQIRAPHYSDYHRTFVNGQVKYTFGLPGIECSACGHTWLSSVRVIPFSLPATFRSTIYTKRGPVDLTTFRAISEELRHVLAPAHPEVADFEFAPGQNLLPGVLDISSRPEADFLWAGWCPVVSGRVRESLEHHGVTGTRFFPATLGKIGTRSTKLPPPIPSSGEPEDIMTHARRRKTTEADVPNYHHMVICGESKWPDYLSIESECEVCGFRSYVPPGPMYRPEWNMLDTMWAGTDVFRLLPTSMPVVTDSVRRIIEGLAPTNVAYDPI